MYAGNILGTMSVSGKWSVQLLIQESQIDPDPDTFEKYHDAPPISSAMLLQKYALLLAESSICTTSLYRDAAPICIAILLQKY